MDDVHRSYRRAVLSGVLLGAFLLVPGVMKAGANTTTDLYVAQSGSGAVCTQATPCGSVETAVSVASGLTDDVVINVGAGSYNEASGVTISGNSESSLTISGAGSSSTTVQPGAGATLFTLYQSFPVTIEGVTISGADVTGDAGGVASFDSGGLTLSDDMIAHNAASNEGGGVDNGGSLDDDRRHRLGQLGHRRWRDRERWRHAYHERRHRLFEYGG